MMNNLKIFLIVLGIFLLGVVFFLVIKNLTSEEDLMKNGDNEKTSELSKSDIIIINNERELIMGQVRTYVELEFSKSGDYQTLYNDDNIQQFKEYSSFKDHEGDLIFEFSEEYYCAEAELIGGGYYCTDHTLQKQEYDFSGCGKGEAGTEDYFLCGIK